MYFRLEKNGSYISKSGCGNDTRSENPAMSQMILESVRYWMTEYHIDGFRFDIGNLIDSETRQKIIDELKKINPHVIILAEPWGDGYDPSGFSEMGWASFNDLFRDGLKGSVFDVHNKGFLLLPTVLIILSVMITIHWETDFELQVDSLEKMKSSQINWHIQG